MASSARIRKLIFASLYLSEGAPIGFIWLAMPTRLRVREVPIEQITWLTALLVLPWTFKFLWAPLVDLLRGQNWSLRHWIVTAQLSMGLSLLPLLWLDPLGDFQWVVFTLLVHAFSAATQDVAIDAYCIATTRAGERGEYNGWMQTGMLAGRALMGGGALVMSRYLGDSFVVVLLVALTLFSTVLVIAFPQAELRPVDQGQRERFREIWSDVKMAIGQRNTWIGLFFGAVGGAAFKSLEVFYGPYLVDRGMTQDAIGWFSMLAMIGMMILGSLMGGWLADRFGARTSVGGSLLMIVASVIALGLADRSLATRVEYYGLPLLAFTALGIGVFTASSYAMFMDLTEPRIAATQFSAFMGSTNGCEAWSSFISGLIIAQAGYPAAMLVMAGVSLMTLPVLAWLQPHAYRDVTAE